MEHLLKQAPEEELKSSLVLIVSLSVDCEWADWSRWSRCPISCNARDGTGNQTRTRVPKVKQANGGRNCSVTTASTTVGIVGNIFLTFNTTLPDDSQNRTCEDDCPSK